MNKVTIRDAVKDLLDVLTAAVRRVEMANAEGNPILSAWLPDANAAIENARLLPEAAPVVVWLTKGGVVEHVSSPDADVVVIDFQNLEAGDQAPDLSESHKELLKKHAPSVMDDIAYSVVHYRCENCSTGYHSITELKPVTDLEQRVAPGEPVPVGECPACGAVVHPVANDWWPVPQAALDRHYLSGRFNLAPEALPQVHKVGLDQVLAWFETTHGVAVGDNLPVSDFGLNAYFGFDPDKPNGECCYVNITVLR